MGEVSAYAIDAQTEGTILYVKPGANGDCLSWDTACELQTAIFNAVSGDQIWVAAGTYKPTTSSNREATFQLENGVAIYGGFPAAGGDWSQRDWETNTTNLSGDIGLVGNSDDNSYHVVTGSGVDTTAVLDGFTINGGKGYAGGGMVNNAGSPSLTNIIISLNTATSSGGGMYNSGSSPILSNVIFSGNTIIDDWGYGGGMYNYSSSPILSNVTFSDNTFTADFGHGGGMYNSESSPILTNATFSGNTAYFGGGMENSGGNPILTDVTFSSNSAEYGGGMENSGGNPILTNVTFSLNSANWGGGLNNSSGNPILTDVTFSGNSALDGGGMQNSGGNPILTNVTFSDNITGDWGKGGGMSNLGSNPTLSNVTFSGNLATFYGGGMYNSNSSPTLTNVTFSGNSVAGVGAFSYGGGMSNYASSPSLTNVTFSDNTAVNGGGMYNSESSPSLTNVTFSENIASSAGGGLSNDNSSPILTNTILWGNTPNQISGSATVTYSDIQGGYAGIGNINVDPLLGSLADNGGFTKTLALGENSPAIDVANSSLCPGFDQRYYARPADGNGDGITVCDMGAYEYGALLDGFLLSVDVLGSGTVLIDPQQTGYLYGDVVNLTAIADGNWVFTGWSGDASGTDNPLSVTVDASKNITANFSFDAWTLTLSVSPEGSGEVVAYPDQPTYHYGDQVTLTAIAGTDWVFTDWGGDVNSMENPLTLTIHDDTSITANFKFNAWVLTVSVYPEGAGSVSLNPDTPTYPDMSDVSATAIPNPGWSFAGWTGDASGATNPTSITMSSHKSITANFTQDEYSLNVNINPEGVGYVAISPSKPNYHYGDIVTLTATANAGWTFSSWSGDGISTDNPFQVTIDGNTSISANFTPNEYTLAVSILPAETGTLDIDPEQATYHYGDVVTLTPLGNPGWRFGSWDGDATGTDNPLVYTIYGNTSITANFTQGVILYVKPGANGDCYSWATACELQTAIFNAGSGDQIWVATGAYLPTTSLNRESTFQLKSGVAIFGGFPAEGGEWGERNLVANLTTLSGDIGIIGDVADNSYHVVTGSGVDRTSVLDGFTITSGNANGVEPHKLGGGMYNDSGNPTVTNTTFIANSSTFLAGGMWNINSSPTLTNVTFSGNYSSGGGGGMMNETNSSPNLTNINFIGNSASSGGGMYNRQYSNPTLTNVTFSNNSSSNAGGGMHNSGSSSPNLTNVTFTSNWAGQKGGGIFNAGGIPTLTNVTFTGNMAGSGGGIYNDWQSSPVLTNVTFTGNTAGSGGGIYNYSGSPTLTNTILWGNTPNQISGSATVTYSDVQGGYAGIGNINVDPLLGNLADNGGFTQTHALSEDSLAIDAGNPFSCPPHDQRGYSRPIDGDGNESAICDMGAYEYGASPSDGFTLSVDVIGNGMVATDPVKDRFFFGEIITSTAIADDNWEFTSWGGDASGTDNPLVHEITGNTSISACFTPDEYTLAVSILPADSGIVNINPEQATYHYGDVVTLTLVPNAGWSFDNWSGDASGNDNPLTLTIVGDTSITANLIQIDYTLAVGIEPEGKGSVVIDPVQETYHYGDVVTITPSAIPGWTFVGWSGDETGTDNPLTVTIDGNTSITANFTQDEYTLAVSILPADSGIVNINPEQATYHYGDLVTLTLVPNAGWSFTSWSGDASGNDNPLTFTIEGNTSITANLTQIEYTLAVGIEPEGKGSVVIEPLQTTYHYGDMVTLTASGIPGWSFSGWGGDYSGIDNPLVVTIQGSVNITANFTQDEYTLLVTINPEGKGSVVVSPEQATYHFGDVVTLTPSAISGWSFGGWDGDATGTDNPLVYTISGNTSITANFTQIEYTLNVGISPADSGTVTVDPVKDTYHYGDVVTLTALPNENWLFDSWSGDINGTENPLTVTIEENTNIIANFIVDEWSLNVSVTPEGMGSVTVDPLKESYQFGDEVTLTATAIPGWSFAGWSGDAEGMDNPLSITIDGNTSITANFTQDEYVLTITIEPVDAGSVSVTPVKDTYHYGDEVTLTAIPGADWSFGSWSGDFYSLDNPFTITITGDTGLSANFDRVFRLYMPLITRN